MRFVAVYQVRSIACPESQKRDKGTLDATGNGGTSGNERSEKSDKKVFELIEIISKSMIFNERFILLTTKSEMKTGYLKALSEIIEDMFEYPIIDYKKDRYKSFTYHPARVGKNIKYYEDNVLKEFLSTSIGREKALEYMTKKEMKKILKKKGLYSKVMSKSDMKDMLKVFYVEER